MNSNGNAGARVRRRGRRVVTEEGVCCTRCGAAMRSYLATNEDSDAFRMLWWTCENGHATQAIPVPEYVLGVMAGPRTSL